MSILYIHIIDRRNVPAAALCVQVLGEDLKLVLGQQDRLERGSDTWANPVSYDKLGALLLWWLGVL